MINVITGMPRSGTSLVSKLIHDAVGPAKFYGAQWRQADTEDEIKTLNVNGFYESDRCCKPIRHEFCPDGHWLKCITPALVGSSTELVGKVVLCIRDPLTVAASRAHMREVIGRSKMAQERRIKERPEAGVLTSDMYVAAMGRISRWVILNHRPAPHIVDYTWFVDNPEAGAQRLSAYTGLQISSKTIDKIHSRSQPIKHTPEWSIAMESYQAMQNHDFHAAIRLYEKHACSTCAKKRLQLTPQPRVSTSNDNAPKTEATQHV